LSSVPDLLFEIDSSGVCKWANEATIQFYGKHIIGEKLSELLTQIPPVALENPQNSIFNFEIQSFVRKI